MGGKNTKIKDDIVCRMVRDIESLKKITIDQEQRIQNCESDADKDRAAFQESLMKLTREAKKDRKELGDAVLNIANHGRENQTADIRHIANTSPEIDSSSM